MEAPYLSLLESHDRGHRILQRHHEPADTFLLYTKRNINANKKYTTRLFDSLIYMKKRNYLIYLSTPVLSDPPVRHKNLAFEKNLNLAAN